MASLKIRSDPGTWKASRGYPSAWSASRGFPSAWSSLPIAPFADVAFQKNPKESQSQRETAPHRIIGKATRHKLRAEKKDSENSSYGLKTKNIQARAEAPKITAQAWREEVRRRAEAAISSKRKALLAVSMECDSLRADLRRVNDAIQSVTTDPWVVVLSFANVAWSVMRYLPLLRRWRNGDEVSDPLLEDALDLTRELHTKGGESLPDEDDDTGCMRRGIDDRRAEDHDRRCRAEDHGCGNGINDAGSGGISFSRNGARTEVFVHCSTMNDAAALVEKQGEILGIFPPVPAQYVNVFMEPENPAHRKSLELMNPGCCNASLREPTPPFVPIHVLSSTHDHHPVARSFPPRKVHTTAPSLPISLSTPRHLPLTTPLHRSQKRASPFSFDSPRSASPDSSPRPAKMPRMVCNNAYDSALLSSLSKPPYLHRLQHSTDGAAAQNPFASSQQLWARTAQRDESLSSVFARYNEHRRRDVRGRRRGLGRGEDVDPIGEHRRRDSVAGSNSPQLPKIAQRSNQWKETEVLNDGRQETELSKGDRKETELSNGETKETELPKDDRQETELPHADRGVTEVLRPSVAALVGFDEPFDNDEDDFLAE
eukprot:GEMP01019398.1.p1 GENE.GEMP01019398.1~~GEMP01019398.1.p1  ORF type:complete len:599 (+),score=137.99 GEMP01019398.1:224-2020(+)